MCRRGCELVGMVVCIFDHGIGLVLYCFLCMVVVAVCVGDDS